MSKSKITVEIKVDEDDRSKGYCDAISDLHKAMNEVGASKGKVKYNGYIYTIVEIDKK